MTTKDWTPAYESMTDIAEAIDDLVTWTLAERPGGSIQEDVLALGVAYRKVSDRIDAVRQASTAHQAWYKQAALIEGGM